MVDQSKESELHEAMERFYFAYRSFTEGPDRILRAKSLSRAHHRILYFVARNPHININELLGVLAVTKQALNAPLRKLIELRLVRAELAKHDRRVKQLTLSGEGKKLEARLSKTQMAHLEKVFAKCGKRAVLGWSDVMTAMPDVTRC